MYIYGDVCRKKGEGDEILTYRRHRNLQYARTGTVRIRTVRPGFRSVVTDNTPKTGGLMRRRTAWLLTGAVIMAVSVQGCGKKVKTADLPQARTESAVQTTEEKNLAPGKEAGTFVIEDAGIEVKLIGTDITGDGKAAQAVIDAKDSAAFFRYGVEYVIGDHKEDGFDRLGDIRENESEATIRWKNGETSKYLCTKVCGGTNEGRLYDDAGFDLAEVNDGGIAVYTCADDETQITVTYWQKTG